MIAIHDFRKVLVICLFIIVPSIAWLQVPPYPGQHLLNRFGYPDGLGSLGYQTINLGSEELDGQSCWRLQLDGIPEKDSPYPKIVMLVRQLDNCPLSIDYYDGGDTVAKTLSLKRIEEVNGVPVGMEMTVKNHLDGTETSFSLTFNYEFPLVEGSSTETKLGR